MVSAPPAAVENVVTGIAGEDVGGAVAGAVDVGVCGVNQLDPVRAAVLIPPITA